MQCLGKVRAVVFDMDGVLWESASAHARAFAEVLQAAGLPGVAYDQLAGRRTDEVMAQLLAARPLTLPSPTRGEGSASPSPLVGEGWGEGDPEHVADLTRRKQALAFRYLEESPPLVSGVYELLARLRRRFRLALATSSRAENVALFLRASGTAELFDVVLHGGDVRRAKPDPEVYRTAVARLGVEPAEAVVVEDAVSGVQAAVAAGVPALGLLGTSPAADLEAVGAVGVLSRLADLEGRLTRIVEQPEPGDDYPRGHVRTDWTAVIPAAGRGSRLGFDRPKVLYPILGRPILDWLLDLLEPLCAHVVVIASPSGQAEIAGHLAQRLPSRFDVLVQEQPTGMGDAVLLARQAVRTPQSLVIWGDQVTLSPRTLAACVSTHAAEADTALTLPTFLRPAPYIHFRRGPDARIVAVEQARERTISVPVGENDCGVFFFRSAVLFEELARARQQNLGVGQAMREFNLLEVIPRVDDGVRTVRTVRISDPSETDGVNTPLEAERAAAVLSGRLNWCGREPARRRAG